MNKFGNIFCQFCSDMDMFENGEAASYTNILPKYDGLQMHFDLKLHIL